MMMYNTVHDSSYKRNNNIYIELKVLIVSFLLSLIILFFIAKPIYVEMKTNKDQIGLIQKNITLKNVALASLEDFKNENKNIRNEELIKVKSLLQEEDRVELYIANINKISQLNDSDMEIISLLIGEAGRASPDREGALIKATISLSLMGEYDKLIVFLGKIEKLIPLVNLESVEIERSDLINNEVSDYTSLDEKNDITVNIVLSYYYK